MLARIEGHDLARWHERPDWRAVRRQYIKQVPVAVGIHKKSVERMRLTAQRMAQTPWDTALQSGQTYLSVKKDKWWVFTSKMELTEYTLELLNGQDGLRALTRLKLVPDGEVGDDACRCSLDRIDSTSHYVRGNLQVVCKFVNRWKSTTDNNEFRRLIALIREDGKSQKRFPEILDPKFRSNSAADPRAGVEGLAVHLTRLF